MKKRILSLALSLLLLISAVPHLAAFAEGDEPTFVASATEGKPGDTVTVTVSTKNNPGIVSLLVNVGYDANVLELTKIEGADFAGTAFGPLTSNPIAVNWIYAISDNNTTNGVVAVLTFKIKNDAAYGDTAITLTHDPADVYDYDWNDVHFEDENGKVTVKECEHAYDNDCDADCNECGATREAPHKWANACDGECDCGATRTPADHVYENACDADCNVCGAVDEMRGHQVTSDCDEICDVCGAAVIPNDSHLYENACDTDCNECGGVRPVPEHVYDDDCDADCNECGAERIPSDHEYDNACDADCNVCGATRTPADHEYDNACDTTCNVCDEVRTTGAHVVDDDCDEACNVCGAAIEAPHKWENACDAECDCGEIRTPDPHKGGVANCHEKAVCDVCGAEYGEFDPNNHDGDENLVGAEPAFCNKEGYTGDTYCSGCDVLLVKGTAIEKLPHEWTNACDADCNVCGETRTPSDHEYDNACDADCNECGATRTPSDHEYDNACDADCNECGAERTPADHEYDNACDTTCNVCGDERAVPGHVYDDDCDATCNECGANREAPHKWANACDGECDCGLTRTPAPHKGGTATCVKKAVCDVCDAEYGELDPENHTGETVSVNKMPTSCDEEGYTGDIHCADCSALLIKGEKIAKIPHTIKEWTEKKDEGVKVGTCTECNFKATVLLDKMLVDKFDNENNIVVEEDMTGTKLEIVEKGDTKFTEDVVFVADEVKHTINEEETKKVENAIATLKDTFESIKDDILETIAVFDLKLELHEKDKDTGDVVNVEEFKLAEGSKVKVTIPVPQGIKDMYDILKLIHVKDDGTAEEVDYELKNDMATFIAEGFSYYTFVGANKEVTTTTTTTTTKPADTTTTTAKPTDTTTTTTKPAESDKAPETDKSPATGDNTAALWIAVVLVLALSGVLFATAKSKKIFFK